MFFRGDLRKHHQKNTQIPENTHKQNTGTDSRAGVFFGSAGLAKVIGVAVFIWRPTLREISFFRKKFLLPDFTKSKIKYKGFSLFKTKTKCWFSLLERIRVSMSVIPVRLSDTLITSLVEVGTSGLLPSWEYLFDHLSKYVSEQESHVPLDVDSVIFYCVRDQVFLHKE